MLLIHFFKFVNEHLFLSSLFFRRFFFIIFIYFIFVFFITPFSSSIGSSELYSKGRDLAKRGNCNEAEKLFKEAIRISPYYSLAHYGLGRCYLLNVKSKGVRGAIKELKISVNLDESFVPAHFYLGMAYMFGKRYILALKSFKKSYSLDKSFVEALYNMATIYEVIGNARDAAYYFSQYNLKKNRSPNDIFW